MKLSFPFRIGGFLLVASCALISFAIAEKPTASVASLDRKLDHIQANSERAHPDRAPTVFTEQEVNAFLASNQVEFPQGVEALRLEGHPQRVSGRARVDFDRIRAGMGSSNPLLSVFSGVHEVLIATRAYGAGGQAHVHVDSVSLDGVEIPRFVLEMFIDKYLHRQYPEIGMDSTFSLPDRIDKATVGEHTLTVTQK